MSRTTKSAVWVIGLLIAAGAAVVVYRQWTTGAGNAGSAAGAPAGQVSSAAVAQLADLRLELLEGRSQEAPSLQRNPFRFEARRRVAAEASRGPGRASQASVPTAPLQPSGPPPPPPIPLRYIGYVNPHGQTPRLAVLSDGRGNVFPGKEGDIIEGRYRVLRIGSDSADLVYVDGRGRQTIRLTGQ